MKDKQLYFIWGGMYVLCAGLGFIPEPAGLVKALLVLAAMGFFVPAGMLLYRGASAGDQKTLKLFRNLSLLWLGITLVLLVANLLSALGPQWLGNVLHALLVIVSSPMVCSQHWAAVLFLWACVLMVSLQYLKKK